MSIELITVGEDDGTREHLAAHGVTFGRASSSTISAPEPTSIALLGLSLFGLGFSRRKRV